MAKNVGSRASEAFLDQYLDGMMQRADRQNDPDPKDED